MAGRFDNKQNAGPAPGDYLVPSKIAQKPWHMKDK